MNNTKLVEDVLIDKLGVEASEVVPEASLQNNLGMDSLDFVEIIMELEHKLDKAISDESCENVSTVQDLIDVVEKL